MYAEFLQAVLAYIVSLNGACSSIDEANGLAPYVGHVPVLLEDCLCGFLRDEVGGVYQYEPATKAEHEWWESRPWKKD